MKIVATMSLPAVDRQNADRWNAARSRQYNKSIKWVARLNQANWIEACTSWLIPSSPDSHINCLSFCPSRSLHVSTQSQQQNCQPFNLENFWVKTNVDWVCPENNTQWFITKCHQPFLGFPHFCSRLNFHGRCPLGRGCHNVKKFYVCMC